MSEESGFVVDALGDALLEFLLGLTDGTGKLGQLGAAEDHEDDDENDEQLCCAEVHGVTLAGDHRGRASGGCDLGQGCLTGCVALAADAATFPLAHAAPDAELL